MERDSGHIGIDLAVAALAVFSARRAVWAGVIGVCLEWLTDALLWLAAIPLGAI